MAAPSTPLRKRLAISDAQGVRSASTPPANRLNPHLLAPMAASPSSRHSSPGIDRLGNRRRYDDDLIPRRLTASPVGRLKDRDKIRKRLASSSIDDAVNLLKSAKNIVVLTGAGISTSLSIPDFRSDGGFYSKLSSSVGISTPEEFFSIDFFKRESSSFWDNVKPLLPRFAQGKTGAYQDISQKSDQKNTVPRFSKTHAFLTLLQDQDKLLTNYTQNIDGLEFASGVNARKIIQCHGSWETASCLTCGKKMSAKKYLPIVYEEGYPRCKCVKDDLPRGKIAPQKRKAKKRKRAVYEGDSDHDSDDGTQTPKGLVKPDITFFGEKIPEYYVPRLEEDKTKADLLLILGTSLKVRPVKTMLVEFPPYIPQIWVNKDRFSGISCDMPGVHVDIELLGECDVVIEELCRRAGLPLNNFVWKGPSITPLQGMSMTTRLKTDVGSRRANGTSEVQKPFDSSRSSDLQWHQDSTSILEAEPIDTEASQSTGDVEAVAQGTSERQPQSQSTSPTKSTIHVESDLDADWRWRFTRKAVSGLTGVIT